MCTDKNNEKKKNNLTPVFLSTPVTGFLIAEKIISV